MKILYSHRLQSHDGQGVHLESLVAALRSAGHEVLVVGPPGYAEAGLGTESQVIARVRRLLPGFAAELAELAYTIPGYRRLRRAAREFSPDVLYERANLFYLAGALLAGRLGLPFLLEVNSPLAQERTAFGNLRLRRLAGWAERFVWRRADRVLPVTEVLAGIVAAAGVERERIVVVPNGINLASFPPAPPAQAERTTIVLGFIGFVREWHGLDAVLRAMAERQMGPRIVLQVAGEGPARLGLERIAAELGISEHVHFTGLISREAVPKLLAGFDIALQPAAVAYASPLKVFEYMAAGRAIVAPDQPNIREVLTHERTALLFTPGDAAALWAAVMRLASNPELRDRLGASARMEAISRDFTWAGNARRVAEIAEQVRCRVTSNVQQANSAGRHPLERPPT
ncbi:glycosyltransferase family 4 protein [Neoroseomonas lacus]|uniref:Glycosyl transferase family 1 n=1 Tax=Neoroseomonas lacus TaxID=287609 RepID=A0A917P182_9PROT|nr:glycosyltransferase family 4 protein [Neoroseomonas lacus]GGJ44215.1 glycosyl transferase family 1 [Neoroseomonas lacus]